MTVVDPGRNPVNALVQCKAAAKRMVPPTLYERGSAMYRNTLALARKAVIAGRFGFPEVLLHFGIAPGDDLLCTAVLRELKKRGRDRLWIMSNFPELFAGMNDAAHVIPVDQHGESWGRRYKHLEYARYDPQLDRGEPTTRHVIAELCARAGVTGEVDIRPYLSLTETERNGAAWASGRIVIQNSGMGARFSMLNKEWFPERFQEVVNRLHREIKFIQIGSSGDPPLLNAIDLRGKTSIRASAAILSQARLFVGIEGFVMHIARAMECPAVIVLGGRTAPWQFGYTCNVNLYSPLPCSPCWLWNRCDYGRACLDMITTEDVINGIKQVLGSPRGVLAVDKTVI
jgi:hypothetical protein